MIIEGLFYSLQYSFISLPSLRRTLRCNKIERAKKEVEAIGLMFSLNAKNIGTNGVKR